MLSTRSQWFRKGIQDGIPIALGYLAVAFTLGIAAKRAGVSAGQATLISALCNASAGEFVGFTLIAAGASYAELALMELVANARYLLMSCALSQKLDSSVSLPQRLLLGHYITDELFGISVSVPGKLNPYYTFGAILLAAPAWAFGTLFGVLLGNILPLSVVSALSVGLYGMFLAIIIPPCRKSRLLAGLITLSMALSFAVSRISFFDRFSAGTKILLLTVVLSAGAAIFFPVHEESEKEKEAPHDA